MDRYFVFAITTSNKTKKEQMICSKVERLREGLVECPLSVIKDYFEAIVKEANVKYTGKDLSVHLTGTGDCSNRYLRIVAKDEYKDRFCITLVPVKVVINGV